MNRTLWTPKGLVVVRPKVGFQPPVVIKAVKVEPVRRIDPERERALRGA
jgi:hypothetical protein